MHKEYSVNNPLNDNLWEKSKLNEQRKISYEKKIILEELQEINGNFPRNTFRRYTKNSEEVTCTVNRFCHSCFQVKLNNKSKLRPREERLFGKY